MVVDFLLKRAPRFRVGAITRVGPWREDNLRREFRELMRWAKAQRARPGRWIFLERGSNRWEACLEFAGRARATGRVRLKTLPSAAVASVTFDPDQVSSSVVYHALNDWVRRHGKGRRIRGVTGIREIYSGDPWADKEAWAHCEVQFLLRK